MAIGVGDRLPDFNFAVIDQNGPGEISTEELFGGKKVVLFAVPGAFTPTCTQVHLPGYIENVDAIKAKGIDEVAVVSINDAFVMHQWALATNSKGTITFLADGNGDFARQIGMELNLGGAGLGVRSKRYSMIVEDGVVTALNLEETPKEAVISGADAILEQL